ncbi:uncharacterized protein LOC132884950 [Neoarius graeffei]|uniref:uncharacterized protein LOC132884950 n=1 Tax=Neoarius graeffei TaxID=443677 RepID=UPI00298BD658|nr:uncharacterized protein LOC132884950 [Neoarius graeffei]
MLSTRHLPLRDHLLQAGSQRMSTLPYQKVIWKERGTPVSRIVPVNEIMESHDKTFIVWPNKVNGQKDIERQTKPGNNWQFFKVLKWKQFYEEAVNHLRRQLARSKADKRGHGVPAIPNVFEDINKETERKRAINTKPESVCHSMIDDDNREKVVSESELSDVEEAERLRQLEGDISSSDSEIDQPTKRHKMSKGGDWDRLKKMTKCVRRQMCL